MNNIKNVLFLMVLIVLSGCQTTAEIAAIKNKPQAKAVPNRVSKNQQDSAPLGPIPQFFKKLIPKHEPLSRYGNPGTYRVDGRTYSVLKTSKGFHERGLASWYGTKFHRMRTSSGDAYNMYELTAAHKTLPLPTYIRVKNLDNGREAVVKVNDRGPFHSGRIIDLSYGAAAKLGIFPRGTANVEISALSLPGKVPVGHYYLQAGAYNSAKTAEIQRLKLSKLTRTRVFVEKYQRSFIVRVGPFANKNTAEQLKNTFKRKGVSGVFVSLR